MSLMMSQPRIDITSPVHAFASFDPPSVRPGEQSTYRITLNALEESVDVPAELTCSPGLDLRRSAHGQVFSLAFDKLVPITQMNYRAHAEKVGTFVVPEFSVQVYGKPVIVPAAELQVMAAPPPGPITFRPILELTQTNLLAGQSVPARIVLAGPPGAAFQTLGQVQFIGEGIVVDQGSVRQRIESKPRELPSAIAFIYEVMITPIQAGKITLSAQGFTSRNAFSGPIVITAPGTGPGAPPQQTLVETDPVQVNVRPLPLEGRLPGFTGAIGRFHLDPPKLQTNTLRVGDPVRMDVLVQSEGNMPRLVPPPPPNSRDWQILSANDNPVQLMQPRGAATVFHYTLVPFSAEAQTTPAIPFSYYDPERGAYVDMTIPPLPVTVTPGQVPSELMAMLQTNRSLAKEDEQLTLRGLAAARGLTAHSLVPLQQETWFSLVQLIPAAGFAGLLSWDRRRRYLEQHPDVILRARARRALRRQRRALRHAARVGDADAFAIAAVNAMRVACAPHYPAEPRALVGSDVLQVLGPNADSSQSPALVRRFFAFTDAAQFSPASPHTAELLSLEPELEHLLEHLEAKL